MFVGREEELNTIIETIKTPAKHVLIYGNRRVGKTTLAIEAAKQSHLLFVNYECKKDSLEKNAQAMADLLFENSILPAGIVPKSMRDLFSYVNSLNQRMVFLIDEYPYLYTDEKKEKVDSIFQNIIDQCSLNINIIISGSHIGMMKQMTQETNPLFGRFNAYIHLQELDYLEASQFYPNMTNYDKAAFYAVFGGSPFVLEQLDYEKGLEYNIKKTFLNINSTVNMFLSENYTSDLSTKDAANKILEALGNSRIKYTLLEQKIGLEKTGLLSKQLNTLLDMNFIGKNYPINKPADKKKITYYIKNNALRFYYNYVYGKVNLIAFMGADEFYEQYIKESLKTFISYRFEDIAMQFMSKIVKKGLIKGITNVGTYYYDDIATKTNGEFDVAIQKKNVYDIIEVKYLKDKVTKQIIEKEVKQIKSIKELDIDKIGFISINGFESDVKKLDYMFDGDDVYFN